MEIVNGIGWDVILVRYCTDPSQEEALNLLEDGLQLWQEALRQAPAPAAELTDLFPNLTSLTSISTEHVQVCTSTI